MATERERNRGLGAYSTPGVDPPADKGLAKITTANPVVVFKLQHVDPPSSLYLSQAERLAVGAINSDPNVGSISLNCRLLRASDGQITPMNLSMAVGSNRVPARQIFDMTEGYLLGAELLGAGGTTPGRCYLTLDVGRGAGPVNVNFTLYQQLISDYFSRGHNAAWPGGKYAHSTEDAGWARGVTGTTPAAGAEINEVVPTTARWRLKSARFRLVTSATVANRDVGVIIQDISLNPIALVSFNLLQAATTTVDYTIGIGLNPVNDATGNVSTVAIPDNLLFAGFAWKTRTINLQAGDQYSFVEYAVEEWIEL